MEPPGISSCFDLLQLTSPQLSDKVKLLVFFNVGFDFLTTWSAAARDTTMPAVSKG